MTFLSMRMDPYRLFFPTGIFFAIAGVLPWAVLITEQGFYPAEYHRLIMINGFLLSFIVGFLMTAIPRFTETEFARGSEVFLAWICLLFDGVFAMFRLWAWHHFFASVVGLLLFLFFLKRFRNRRANLPPTFLFVAAGMGLLILANTYFFLFYLNLISEFWFSNAFDILTNGAILSLILGVGGRLIPALLGRSLPLEQERGIGQKHLWLFVSLFVSLYLFNWLPLQENLTLRAAIIFFFAVKYWKLHLPPKERNYFTWSLWLSAWAIVIGCFLIIFSVGPRAHFLHFLFVAGFSMLILLISLHVVLSHQQSMSKLYIKNSKALIFVTSFIFLSMATRVTAIIWPKIYLKHLGYAAMTWLLALLIWIYFLYLKPYMSSQGRPKDPPSLH